MEPQDDAPAQDYINPGGCGIDRVCGWDVVSVPVGCGCDAAVKNGLKKATVLIVKRGAEFLVGRIHYSMEYRWSTSAYDAWQTRDKEDAKGVAKRVGGDLWLFNPPTGQLREAKITT